MKFLKHLSQSLLSTPPAGWWGWCQRGRGRQHAPHWQPPRLHHPLTHPLWCCCHFGHYSSFANWSLHFSIHQIFEAARKISHNTTASFCVFQLKEYHFQKWSWQRTTQTTVVGFLSWQKWPVHLRAENLITNRNSQYKAIRIFNVFPHVLPFYVLLLFLSYFFICTF